MRILIVDDEKLARMNIKQQLDSTYFTIEADTFEKAHTLLSNESFDLCFIDLNLSNESELLGLKLIPLAYKRGIYTVVMSSHEEDDVINKAYTLGCKDYYTKGNEGQNVSETINRFLIRRESFNEENLFKNIFPTNNETQKNLIKRLIPVIPSEIPICILGPSGAGKTHLAQKIHELSKRSGEFVSINCAALSENMLEAELFGYSKGAFTGASEKSFGKIALAHNGTLFLDEFGSMSAAMQSKLLKAIEEKSYFPMNSDKKVKSSFRLISATQDDPEDLIKKGKFRFDLFQRICGVTTRLLPLKLRKEDILPILRAKLSSSRRTIFSEEVKGLIEEYEWPGNIRELLNFGEVVTRTCSGRVEAQDFRDFIKGSAFKTNKDILTKDQLDHVMRIGLAEFIALIEKEAAEHALTLSNSSVRSASNLLKVTRKRTYRALGPTFRSNSEENEAKHELQ